MSLRTKNSIHNITVSVIMGFVATVINFITQKVFADSLGVEYLGLNGLFTNIVSMLTVVELGLGSAVVYNLYKPLKEGDSRLVSSIMSFYKNGYRLVAVTVLVIGALIIPLLPKIVGENSVDANIPIVYMLFILNVVASYLLSYKRSLLYADQKSYLINSVHLSAIVVLNILQVLILIMTKNYYLYLIIKIVMTIIENIIISSLVDSRYTLVPSPEPLDSNIRKDIFTKIRGLLYHKFGSFFVLGSTNIIISILLGIKLVGIYSNYLLIQNAIYLLFSQISTAITASIGNLLLGDTKKEHYVVFKRLYFAMHSLTIVCVSIFFIASSSFILIWLGKDYVFSIGVTIALTLNVYLFLIRSVFSTFKDAAGIFYEDRYVPIFESAINIIASVILIHFIGVAGAFIGTALSSLTLHGYSYPKYVYKEILGRSYREYALLVIKNFLITILIVTAVFFIDRLLDIDEHVVHLLISLCIGVVVPCLILWLIYRKSEEYKYFKKLINKVINKSIR